MDEKERVLRKTLGKFHAVDTGRLILDQVYDTGANFMLWSWIAKRLKRPGITDTGDEQNQRDSAE